MKARSGIALPAVLLLLLALTGLGHMALLMAREELDGAGAATRLLEGRVEALSALARTEDLLASGTISPSGGTPVSGSLNPGYSHRVDLHSVAPEFVLLEARIRGPAGRLRFHAARVLWAMDPEREEARVTAGVEYGGVLRTFGTGAVEDGKGRMEWEGSGDSCVGAGSLRLHRRRDYATSEDGVRLGIFELPGVREAYPGARGGNVVSGVGASSFPVPMGSGSVGLRDEELVGTAVVVGHLRLEGTARLRGYVLVSGDLELHDRARIEGVVRVGRDIRIRDSASIQVEPCFVEAALRETGDLLRPVRVPGGGWLGSF